MRPSSSTTCTANVGGSSAVMTGNGSASMRDRRGDATGDQHGQPAGPAGRTSSRTPSGRGRPAPRSRRRDGRGPLPAPRRWSAGSGPSAPGGSSTGGWCRQTRARSPGARAASSRRPARPACPGRSTRGRSARPAARGPWSPASGSALAATRWASLTGRSAGSPAHRGVPLAHVVVARCRSASAPGPGHSPQHGRGLGVLVGGAVVGEVAGDQQRRRRAGRGSREVGEHATRPVGRRPAAAEVGVAEVGDDQHPAIVAYVGSRAKCPAGRNAEAPRVPDRARLPLLPSGPGGVQQDAATRGVARESR